MPEDETAAPDVGGRNRASTAVRQRLRAAFGLFPLYEFKNRCLLGPRTIRLRRFETAEVVRIRALLGQIPTTECVTVIPTFRRPVLLANAVESALSQTFEDNLVVVVDDGGGELPDLPPHPRLRMVSLSRNTRVPGVVRNVAIRSTDSTFIAFLDDDNTWKPNHLATALDVLCSTAGTAPDPPPSRVDLVYTALERRFSDGTLYDTLSHPFDRRAFADGAWVDTNSIVVRRDRRTLFSRLPRTTATLPKEDWEFVYRMARHHTVVHVPVPTVEYLINDQSYHRGRPEEWRAQRDGDESTVARSGAPGPST